MPDSISAESPPPAPTLADLVLSLAAAALTHLGHKVARGGPEPQVNLPLAKHTIDTIELLRLKTEGNRTTEEDEVFEQLLYQLRMAYVEADTHHSTSSRPPAADR